MAYDEDLTRVSLGRLKMEELDGANILVAGATGLIGSCVVDLLMNRNMGNYHVFALGRQAHRAHRLLSRYESNPFFSFVSHDITSALQTDVDFHYIIHAASAASPNLYARNPVEVLTANICGVENLMEYGMKHSMRRFLYVSSGEVYGEGDGRVFSEDYSGYVNPLLVRSCYPTAKRAAENLCISYGSEYGADVVIARPCHVFGPYFTEDDHRVYAEFIRNVLRGEDIVMKSDGVQYRSWSYVVNCAAAVLYIMLNGKSSEAYNIADPDSDLAIRELAETIADIGGKRVLRVNANVAEKSGFNPVTRSVFNVERLCSLGWAPLSPFRLNLESTIEELTRL